MEPLLGPTGINLADTAAFLAETARIFGDLGEENTAVRGMEKLMHGNPDLSCCYADLVHLVTTTLDLSDKTKNGTLQH